VRRGAQRPDAHDRIVAEEAIARRKAAGRMEAIYALVKRALARLKPG